MNETARRALRTMIQVAVALPTLVPVLHQLISWLTGALGADNPVVSWAVAILAGVTAVSALVNALEERGILRAYLKYPGASS